MKKTIVSYYAYLICFVTLACAVLLLGTGVYSIVELTAPRYMLSSNVVRDHKDNQAFIQSHYKSNLHEFLTDGQITSQRLESLEEEVVSERNNALRHLVIVLVVLMLDVGVFYLHWPILDRETNLAFPLKLTGLAVSK